MFNLCYPNVITYTDYAAGDALNLIRAYLKEFTELGRGTLDFYWDISISSVTKRDKFHYAGNSDQGSICCPKCGYGNNPYSEGANVKVCERCGYIGPL